MNTDSAPNRRARHRFLMRGTFALGDGLDEEAMIAHGDRIMRHLLDLEDETAGGISDAAVSLDMGSWTVEVELSVTEDDLLAAHEVFRDAVSGAFARPDMEIQQRRMELAVA